MRIFRKEVREALRDRNLVVQLVLVPLFLYPLLGFGAFQIFQVSRGAAERRPTVVVLDRDLPAPLRTAIESIPHWETVAAPESLDRRDAPPPLGSARGLAAAGPREGPVPSAWLAAWTGASGDSLELAYDRSLDRSRQARDRIRERIESHRDSLIRQRAATVGLHEADRTPWVLVAEDLSPSSERGRFLLSLVLPIFLMIMLPQGAYYAVLDTVVGERERGTWETVLSSPLRREEILFGKFCFAVAWAMIAFALNLVGLLVFLRFVLGMMGVGDSLRFDLQWGPLLIALIAVLLLAISLVAVMMVVAAPARSYREGQAALSPVYLIATFAGMLVIGAGDVFTPAQAWIPILNVTLLLKTALRGELFALPTLLTFVELALLAALALGLAARLSRQEALFFDSSLTLRRLLRSSRGDRARSAGKEGGR